MQHDEIYKIAHFHKYCDKCLHKDLKEDEELCDKCLSESVNLNSHKPVKFINKQRADFLKFQLKIAEILNDNKKNERR